MYSMMLDQHIFIALMATHHGKNVTSTPLNVPLDVKKKKINEQQKREALERKVTMLQKLLKHEEQVREILECVKNKKDSSAISIPNSLPPKAKELLVELAMVEGEIGRLESQITQLKHSIKLEQEITKEKKPNQWPPGTPSHNLFNYKTSSYSANTGSAQDKMGLETKALHFLSKAIKGDYNVPLNEKMGSSRLFFDHETHEDATFQDTVSKKSSLFLRSPSPYRDFRFPSLKPRERNAEIHVDPPLPKSVPNSFLSEENIQQMQPNKLSESIMKCLNFIYIRLLRTSRAMELEKSGPVSRSLQSSVISRSSRAESNLGTMQRESRQQDPYGIFHLEESLPRDIGPYKNLVIFTASSMDPKYISSSGSVPLLKKLRLLMNSLQTVDLRPLNYQQKLAFWINMYNACIMQGFLQYGVPSSPEKLLSLVKKATLNVGGNTINAQTIEHYILSKPSKSFNENGKDDKEAIVRELYGLESMDPIITFALCSGTRSCPAVRLYTGDGIIAELERSKLEYLQASIMVTSNKRIAFPELLLRNTADFTMDTELLVEWVCNQLPTSGSLRKSIVDCFRGYSSGKIPSVTVEKLPYDYEFQYLLAI